MTIEPIERQLAQLDGQGLIRQVQLDPETEYLFRHVLTQEAAYGSLLKQDRRRLHLAVGEVLEREYAHHLDDLAPILARHFDEADEAERAQHYFVRAGEAAARRNANAEAIMLYGRALALAHKRSAPGELLTAIHLRLGRLHEISGGYVAALKLYIEMEMHAEEQGDQPMLLAALMAHVTVHAAPTTLNDAMRGAELAQRALDLARALRDRPAEAKALWLLCMALRFTDRMREAREHGERAIALARELGLREQLAYALNDIFPIYMGAFQFDLGRAVLAEAVQLGREIDNPQLLVDALVNYCEIEFFAGNLTEASAINHEAVEIADRIGNTWGQSYSRWMLGSLQAEQGEIGAAIATFHESIRLGALAGFAFSQIAMRGLLGMTYAQLGAHETGCQMAQASIDVAETLRPDLKGMGYAALATCHARAGKLDRAEAALALARQHGSWIDLSVVETNIALAEVGLAQRRYEQVLAETTEAVIMIERLGARLFALPAQFYRAAALLGLRRYDEACDALAGVVRQSQHIGSRRMVWRALIVRAECEAALGRLAQAAELRAQAEAEIALIAAGLGDDALRETFVRHAHLQMQQPHNW
jgi:tetratricopeptide (TPR) repeat protein